ncbi:uncharacterized protein LOC115629483 [Scaptodrosophila lebanonensis]|uniref:Uncharacterized protein LOC115629483 n=1 Tax=Drosophila lebanonensis TaxID=7225 RepID=A0A6J2U0E0_DROLE|nr:uncharacterized protein LOC115629483 [Scaptodrosophila lebanonensis]
MKSLLCLLCLALSLQLQVEAKSVDIAAIASGLAQAVASTAVNVTDGVAQEANKVAAEATSAEQQQSQSTGISSSATQTQTKTVANNIDSQASNIGQSVAQEAEKIANQLNSTSTASVVSKVAPVVTADGATIIAEEGNEGAKILGGAAAISAPYVKQVDQALGTGASALGNLLGSL